MTHSINLLLSGFLALAFALGCQRQSIGQALCVAASEGDIKRMQELVDQGADVNYPSKGNGFTPLHCAALSCQSTALRFLLDRGANPNAKSRHGDPVLVAGMGSSPCKVRIIELLLDYGADIEFARLYLPTEGISPEIKAAILKRLGGKQ